MSTTFIGTLTHVECGECGVTFGMTPDFVERRRKDHRTFYCPNGHERYYPGATVEEKRIRALERHVEWLSSERSELLGGMTHDQVGAARRANKYGNRAQVGAFWRGHTAQECGECINSCPYPTNRFGFRSAWYDGYGQPDPEAA